MNKLDLWLEIATIHEGFYPGSNSYRLNNPGNLRCTNYTKSLGDNNGCSKNNFVFYKTLEIGTNALRQFFLDAATDKLRSYKSTMSLLDFYKVYAPTGDDNNPSNYAMAVARYIGVPIGTKIKDLIAPASPSEPTEPIKNLSGSTIIPGEFKFISQIDPRWRNVKLGNSTIGKIGCVISSLSAFSSYANCFHNPEWMAKNLKFTPEGLLYWKSIDKVLCFKFGYRYYKFDEKIADEALKNPRKGVIFKIPKYGGHWLLGLRKSDMGYKVADPLGGLPTLIKNNEIIGMTTLVI